MSEAANPTAALVANPMITGGAHTAIVGASAVALVTAPSDHPTVIMLAEGLFGGISFAELAQQLAGNLATHPPLAIVVSGSGATKLLARGPIQVVIHAHGTVRVLDGQGYTTWHEDEVTGSANVTLAPLGTPTPTAEDWIEVGAGLGPAGLVAVRIVADPLHVPLSPDLGGPQPAPAPKPAPTHASPDPSSAEPLEFHTGEADMVPPAPALDYRHLFETTGRFDVTGLTDPGPPPEPAVATQLAAQVPAPVVAAPTPVGPAPAPSVTDPSSPALLPNPEPSVHGTTPPEQIHAADHLPQPPTLHDQPLQSVAPPDESPGLITSVPGMDPPSVEPTPTAVTPPEQPMAAPSPASAPSSPQTPRGRPTAVASAVPGAEAADDLDDATISLAARRAAQAATAEARDGRPRVQAVLCPSGHLNPIHADLCRTCTNPITDRTVHSVVQPHLGCLVFDDGTTVEVDRHLVLGRRPAADPLVADEPHHLVTVSDPNEIVSRTHLVLRIDGWQLQAIDRDSTNNTFVEVPGQPTFQLRSGDPFPVPPGSVIRLGDEIGFTYKPGQR